MIVRASDNLISAARQGSFDTQPTSYPRITAWTGNGIVTPLSIRKSQEIQLQAFKKLQKLVSIMPTWMYDAVMAGNILTMDDNDYYALNNDLRMELEILTR
jgi:hypothetical protein